MVGAPAEPLAQRQPVGRPGLWNPVPSEERQGVGLRSTASMNLVGMDTRTVLGVKIIAAVECGVSLNEQECAVRVACPRR